MEFRILGPLEVVDAGARLRSAGRSSARSSRLSCSTPNRAVSADRLIDALWPARPPAAAANALQYHVSQLRKLARRRLIVTQEPGYLIRVDPDQVDLLRFERLVADAEGADAARASRSPARGARPLARRAARGPRRRSVLARGARSASQAARLAALELRIEADLALGRHCSSFRELEALVHEHPLHERLAGALMRALYGAGRQAEALEVYRTTRQAFRRRARDRAVAGPAGARAGDPSARRRTRAGLCRPGVALDRGARRGPAPPPRPARPRGATCESAQARAHPHAFHN